MEIRGMYNGYKYTYIKNHTFIIIIFLYLLL